MAQTGTKRKASVAGLPGNARPAKRRASKACHCCRSRKVRCDVVESGIPCTNCRLDEVECVVTEGKRRKKSYVEGDLLSHSPVESIEEKGEVQKFPLFDDIDGLKDFALPMQQASYDTNTDANFDFEMKQHKPHFIYQTQGQRMSPEERTKRMSAIGHAPRLSITPVQLPPHLQYHAPTPSRSEIILPQFIAPIPRQMLSEDLEYLQRKGAFQLPDISMRNELLRSYAQYVHPYLPLLDLEDFLSAIEKNQPSNTVSLLLYHAVMFAASAYIDMRYLSAQGYSTRKSARKAYFQRVKLLYDFDWEEERVTVVQAVLLMTYWYESPNDLKDVWYWLGIALSTARTVGINCNTLGNTAFTPQRQRLWKRIWWCIYMRDRIIAIGLRRPTRIDKEDYSVPPLELEDFETTPLRPELCRMLGSCSAVRDGSKRETLALMCIALIQLCHLITDVLAIQYSVGGSKLGVTSETTVRLVPRAMGADSSQVIHCDRNLEEWYASLSNEIRYFKQNNRDRTNNHDGEVICVHRALLSAIYLTTTSALHRPQMMPAMPNLVLAPELRELSKQRVRDAALDITEIYRDLYAHDLIRYLPNTGVTVLLPAIIIHLLDIKSPEKEEKQASTRNFQFCMQVLQRLRDLYSSADFAFAFLDAAIKSTDTSANNQENAAVKDSLSAKTSQSKLNTSTKGSALTPPPDGLDGTNRYNVSNMMQGSFDAMTPPSPGFASALHTNSGISISLKDLENFVGLNDMQHDEHNLSLLVPAVLENSSGVPMDGTAKLYNEADIVPQPTSNDFDHLVNLEAGPDLFAPNQVSIDDSLFKDIDMEWLADSNEDNDNDDEMSFNHASTSFDNDSAAKISRLHDNEQLETPPDSAVSSNDEKSCSPDPSTSRDSTEKVQQQGSEELDKQADSVLCTPDQGSLSHDGKDTQSTAPIEA